MKTVMVTGGCGFIASHFIRLLINNTEFRVVNIDKLTYAGNLENLKDIRENHRYHFVKGDIGNREFIESILGKEKPWGMVNFAAESHVDRSIVSASPFVQTNVADVLVLLESIRNFKIQRFLQISTDEVYGDISGIEPAHEKSTLLPSSPYAASKASADLLCLAYQRTYDLPIIITRSSNNYGPCQFPEKLIPLVIHNAISGKSIPVYGDGLQLRDWIYVNDNCDALLKVLENGKVGSIYNIGTQNETTNLKMVELICAILARETDTKLDKLLGLIQFVSDRPGHDRRYALITKNIKDELDWHPKVPIENGLASTVRWYIENQDWVKRVTSGEYRNYYKTVYQNEWGQILK